MNFDIDTWNPGLAFIFLLAPFVIGLSGVSIGIYIACSRHFDTMLSALPNSAWARQWQIVGTTSLASRCYLVSTLSGALLLSEFNVRKGVLDANDVSNFPPSLRRIMTLSTKLAFVGIAWLSLAFALIKHAGS